MLPLMAAGLVTGLAGTIGKMIGRGKANKQMEKLIGQDPIYNINPEAKKRLALAQTMLNSRMPGAMQVERNLFTNQGNQLSTINKNATDSSQALALASGVYGNTGNQLTQLGIDEAGDYQRRLGNLFGAQEGMINEGDKVFNDSTRRYGNLVNFRQAQNENRQNNWGDIANLGWSAANFGMQGGFGGKAGGGGMMPQRNAMYSYAPAQGTNQTPQFGVINSTIGGRRFP